MLRENKWIIDITEYPEDDKVYNQSTDTSSFLPVGQQQQHDCRRRAIE